MNHSAISYQVLVVFYEFKSWLLIIKSDRYDLSYHRIFSMVFKATITIEWNGWGQPSCSMVFRWFLGPPKWLSTIGQTMRCDGPSFQSRWFRWLATKPRSHPFRQTGQWSFRKDCDIRRWLVRWLATNGACDAFGISEDTALLEIREAIKKWGNSKRAQFERNTIRWQQLFKSLISIFDAAAGFFLFFICMEYATFHISGCHEECSWEMKNKYILSKSK